MSGAANPSAFPVNSANLGGPGAYEADPGMSLRDWFAGQALIGIISGHLSADPSNHFADAHSKAAGEAYEFADALLAQRELSQ